MRQTSTFSLLIERGIGVPTVVDLTGLPLVMGSSLDCDVVIADRFISRRHARVCLDGVLVSVVDLQSRNGTVVNGERLSTAPAYMQVGDCLELASGRVVARIVSSHGTEQLPSGVAIGSRSGSISVNPHSRSVVFDGKAIAMELSVRQWALLGRLSVTRGRPVSASALKQTGWPGVPRSAVSDVSLRTQLSRVRSALRKATDGDVTLSYVQGAGYLLD